MTGDFLIYALVDPRNNVVRYVGKSTSGFERPQSHGYRSTLRSAKKSYLRSWIKNLLADGLTYGIAVLEYARTQEALNSAERRFIAEFRAAGVPLTNLTDGGDGIRGWRHTVEARARISAALRKREILPSTRRKCAAIHQGRRVTAVQRKRMVRAAQNRVADPAKRIQISRALGGKPFWDQMGRRYETISSCATLLGLSSGNICSVLKGRRKAPMVWCLLIRRSHDRPLRYTVAPVAHTGSTACSSSCRTTSTGTRADDGF